MAIKGWGRIGALGLLGFLFAACGNSSSKKPPPDMASGGTTAGTGGTSAAMPTPDPDDGVECTLDTCDDDGNCYHVPRHFMCAAHQRCTLSGCEDGRSCADFFDCAEYRTGCLWAECNLNAQRCFFEWLDEDLDGVAPVMCGGEDCDDYNPSLGAPRDEVCDGRDNDCDGEIDGVDVAGCAPGQSCNDKGACVCDAPTQSCTGVDGCVDFSSDEAHCGACNQPCNSGETCIGGACECNTGQHCGSICRDLQTDVLNCGMCGQACGTGALCEAGDCFCADDTLDCGTGDLLDCKPVLVDVANCGACDHGCPSTSLCRDGTCEAEVQLVRVFGDSGSTPYSAPLALATDGSLFAGLMSSGQHRLLPSGQVSLWTGYAIGKFDAALNPVWTVPTTGRISAIASAGNDVWVGLAENAEFGVGTTTFPLAPERQGVAIAVKLSGADGSILEQHRFDSVGYFDAVKLLTDGSKVWVALFGAVESIDYQGTTTSQAGYLPLYRLGTATPRWIPGAIEQMSLDEEGNLVLGVTAWQGTISFGGDDFTVGRFGASAAVRYSPDLTHQASFVMPDLYYPQVIYPLGSDLLFVVNSNTLFETYDDTGTAVDTWGPGGIPFFMNSSVLTGGKLYGVSPQVSQTKTFSGRDFAADDSVFARFDIETGALDAAFRLPTNAKLSGLTVADAGATLFVSMLVEGAFQLGPTSYGQAGVQGLALAKLALVP